MQIEQTIQQIINNSTELYNTGYTKGKTEGTEEGYASGYIEGEIKGYQEGYGIQDEAIEEANKKLAKTLLGTDTGAETWYDAFWDAIQNKGDYSYTNLNNIDLPITKHAFGLGWTNAIFKPKYDIRVLSGDTFVYSTIEDLRPETVGANIDFSHLQNFNYILRRAKTKYIGIVDMTNAAYGWCLFGGASNLEYVEKVILPPTNDLEFKQIGFNVDNLTHIAFENKFFSAVQFNNCKKLTHESLINILNALYDYVNGELDGSDKNKTLTLGTTNLAKLTDTEKAIAIQKGWTLA